MHTVSLAGRSTEESQSLPLHRRVRLQCRHRVPGGVPLSSYAACFADACGIYIRCYPFAQHGILPMPSMTEMLRAYLYDRRAAAWLRTDCQPAHACCRSSSRLRSAVLSACSLGRGRLCKEWPHVHAPFLRSVCATAGTCARSSRAPLAASSRMPQPAGASRETWKSIPKSAHRN